MIFEFEFLGRICKAEITATKKGKAFSVSSNWMRVPAHSNRGDTPNRQYIELNDKEFTPKEEGEKFLKDLGFKESSKTSIYDL